MKVTYWSFGVSWSRSIGRKSRWYQSGKLFVPAQSSAHIAGSADTKWPVCQLHRWTLPIYTVFIQWVDHSLLDSLEFDPSLPLLIHFRPNPRPLSNPYLQQGELVQTMNCKTWVQWRGPEDSTSCCWKGASSSFLYGLCLPPFFSLRVQTTAN